MREEEVRRHYESGVAAFEKILGRKPAAFAAPAWLCSGTSLKLLDELGFRYASDTRGKTPFFPSMNGNRFKTLQVPTTLPTLDEMLSWDGINQENVNERLSGQMKTGGLSTHVHSIHTEVEGTALFTVFSAWVETLKKEGSQFLSVGQIAEEALQDSHTPACEVTLPGLSGRAGKVACRKWKVGTRT